MAVLFPFLPFPLPSVSWQLSRYLPLLPEGLVSTWLKEALPQRSWVLDPFGSQPRLAIEAAQAGFRLLITCNNPIERFLLELMAHPPTQNELQAALADLSVSMRGAERIEEHIRSLYATDCANCGEVIEAQAYIWDREADALHARIYHCPNCGDSGSHPISAADVERASQFKRGGLHWFRAIERVTPMTDPDRIHVEEALATYTPRAVYALFTLINLLDRVPETRKRGVRALLLNAFEQGNSLWSLSTVRERPRQLRVSAQYLERNIWHALEEGVGMWLKGGIAPGGVNFTVWPELPPDSGGICLFAGPLRALVERWQNEEFPERKIQGIVAAIPRPNQAYWTLSALWAGWLWGPEATIPLKSVLRRRRYDSNWHCSALHSLFRSLGGLVTPGTPFWGNIGETEQGSLAASLIAAEMAGLELEGIALRDELDQAQFKWNYPGTSAQVSSTTKILSPEGLRLSCLEIAYNYLIKRREPAKSMQLFTAVLSGLIKTGEFKNVFPTTPAEKLTLFQETYSQTINERGAFRRFGTSERSSETGQWWLNPTKEISPSLETDIDFSISDQVEWAVIFFLSQNPGCTFAQVDYAVCQDFEGLLTPDQDLIEACLLSYGKSNEGEEKRWYLKPQEDSAARGDDLNTISQLVRNLGENLGLTIIEQPREENWVTDQRSIHWLDSRGVTKYRFNLLATAACSQIIKRSINLASHEGNNLDNRLKRDILVIPGGRSELMLYKLEHNLQLKAEIEARWRVVKFRLIHRLVDNLVFDLDQLEAMFDLDPLAYQDPQMPLI